MRRGKETRGRCKGVSRNVMCVLYRGGMQWMMLCGREVYLIDYLINMHYVFYTLNDIRICSYLVASQFLSVVTVWVLCGFSR